jgi:hypothetical protein
MEHREDEVEAQAVDGAPEHEEIAVPAGQQRDLGRRLGNGQRAGAGAGAVPGLAQNPAPIPADADRDHLVPVRIERAQDVGGRHARDVVLGGAPAEQGDRPQLRLAHALSLFLPILCLEPGT